MDVIGDTLTEEEIAYYKTHFTSRTEDKIKKFYCTVPVNGEPCGKCIGDRLFPKGKRRGGGAKHLSRDHNMSYEKDLLGKTTDPAIIRMMKKRLEEKAARDAHRDLNRDLKDAVTLTRVLEYIVGQVKEGLDIDESHIQKLKGGMTRPSESEARPSF
jgi:hypothetical protein